MFYLDTSALVKLVVEEAETKALRRFVTGLDARQLVTSALTRAELLRAAWRRDEATVRKAQEVLAGVTAITITEGLLDRAGSLAPVSLRTPDAIHLATALELGAGLLAFVAYDARLVAAAAEAALPTLAPA